MELYQRLLLTIIPILVFIVIFRLIQNNRKLKNELIEDENNDLKGESRETKTIKNKRILRIPFFYRLVFLLLLIFCIAMSIYGLICQFDEWPYIIILDGGFGLPSIIAFTCWSLWKVEILPEGFIYRNYFGIKRKYNFADLEYKMHTKGSKWYFYKSGKIIICVAYYIEGENKLLRAYKKYVQQKKKNDSNKNGSVEIDVKPKD